MSIITNPSTINQQSSSPVGSYHLADNPDLYEVQRSNNFEFVINNFDTLDLAGSTSATTSKLINGQEIIRLSVSASSVPHFKQSVIEVRRGNSVVKFAGTPTFDEGSLVVVDYIGADTKAYLMAWQNLSYNVTTEKVGLVQDYKRDCTLIEYSPDYQVVREWKLYGCWISGLSEDNYDNERNDSRKVTATIQYDHAAIDYSDIV